MPNKYNTAKHTILMWTITGYQPLDELWEHTACIVCKGLTGSGSGPQFLEVIKLSSISSSMADILKLSSHHFTAAGVEA